MASKKTVVAYGVPIAPYSANPFYLEIAQGMVPGGKERPMALKNTYTRLDLAVSDAIDLACKYGCHIRLMQVNYCANLIDRDDIRWCKISP